MKSVSNNASIAILGGTFDPVHIGHLRIAIRLRDAGFDQVLLIPNCVPPHRDQPLATGEQRLRMLELAVAELNGIAPSDIELSQGDTSYSARTVALLKEQYPQANLTWVMGTDAWNGFDRWKTPEDILARANVLVISRPGDQARTDGWLGQILDKNRCQLSELHETQHGGVCHQAWPELDISASDLRQALKQGDNIAFLTPQPVLDYIKEHQLYR